MMALERVAEAARITHQINNSPHLESIRVALDALDALPPEAP